jgi:hypothetical protein
VRRQHLQRCGLVQRSLLLGWLLLPAGQRVVVGLQTCKQHSQPADDAELFPKPGIQR